MKNKSNIQYKEIVRNLFFRLLCATEQDNSLRGSSR